MPLGASSLSHRGERFGIGTKEDRWAIWNLDRGGIALSEFPKTDEGWAHAWARFQSFEQESQAASPGATNQVVMMNPETNGKAVAAMVLGIVWLYGIGAILAIIFGVIAKGEIARSEGRMGGMGMATAGIVLGIVGLGLLLIFVIVAATATRYYY